MFSTTTPDSPPFLDFSAGLSVSSSPFTGVAEGWEEAGLDCSTGRSSESGLVVACAWVCSVILLNKREGVGERACRSGVRCA
jgi:hypothetical protein